MKKKFLIKIKLIMECFNKGTMTKFSGNALFTEIQRLYF